MKKLKAVYVEWVDAKGISGWVDLEDADDVSKLCRRLCYSVGFVCHEDDDFLTLTYGFTDGSVLDRISIPKCSIKKRRRVKLP